MVLNHWARLLAGAALLAGITFDGGPASAQQGTLTVNATVAQACTITGATLAFGTYLQAQGAKDGQVNISLNCPSGVPVTINLGAGSASGGSSLNDPRNMTGPGGATLSYQLFRDPTRSQVWRDGVNGKAITSVAGPDPHTVYGRITGGQTSATGSYTDTVLITLTIG